MTIFTRHVKIHVKYTVQPRTTGECRKSEPLSHGGYELLKGRARVTKKRLRVTKREGTSYLKGGYELLKGRVRVTKREGTSY